MCRYFCDLNLFKMKGGKHFTRSQKRNVLERILQNSGFLRQHSTIITRSILKSRNSELIYRHWHLIFFSPCLVTVSVVVVQDYETLLGTEMTSQANIFIKKLKFGILSFLTLNS